MIWSIVISLANVACVVMAIETSTFDAWSYGNLLFAITCAFAAGTEK